MNLSCMNAGGMENLLQMIERQRERKANRSGNSSHNSSGSDAHDGGTFTVGLLNATHDVDKCHQPLSTEGRLSKHDAVVCSGSDGSLQLHLDAAEETVTVNHIRHHVDEPVLVRSEANSLWKKDDPPKVIPRKVASVPVTSHQSMSHVITKAYNLYSMVNVHRMLFKKSLQTKPLL